MSSVIEIKDIVKVYGDSTKVLNGFSYEFENGRFYAIMGRSGA